jgi:2-keto-4-pentenoate hydratase/2-oxohepta-3-ene-1,7-dioic acid hydratase in catechol pathway
VFGYVLHNDVTEREFQIERGGTWDKGKGCDTFAPIGPFIATKDEFTDIDNLKIWLKLNGELMQDGNTSDFIYRVPKLISYLSHFMSLLPGDIISTGSPAGSGMGKSSTKIPERWRYHRIWHRWTRICKTSDFGLSSVVKNIYLGSFILFPSERTHFLSLDFILSLAFVYIYINIIHLSN